MIFLQDIFDFVLLIYHFFAFRNLQFNPDKPEPN